MKLQFWFRLIVILPLFSLTAAVAEDKRLLTQIDHCNVVWTSQSTNAGGSMPCRGGKIRLLPAWPGEWNADFKLLAPFKSTVEDKVRSGKVTLLQVSPKERQKDLTLMLNEGLPALRKK